MRAVSCAVVAMLAMLMMASMSTAATKASDVDIEGSDGTSLAATYTSPGQPGPAMLLIHQCNMDRTAWKGLTEQLVGAGVHVLTMDLRGFGDTVTPGVADTIQRAVDGSKNSHSIAKIYDGTEHGLPMFAKNAELEPLLVEWLASRLTK